MIRIKVTNVSKTFDLDAVYCDGALAKLVSMISNSGKGRKRHVLRDVSFEAASGEAVGLIGRNGSGKTTLMRLIGGTYLPDRGSIETKGEMVYLAGFAPGLIPKLSMRENIMLTGVMHGLSIKEMNGKLDEIIDFSGLEDYVDVKIYQFSSGMRSRLAFSVTMHCIEAQNPDILLIDEAIGTFGDVDFEDKAKEKMNELILNSATVILATHNMSMVKKYCQKVILIENGGVRMVGDPVQAVDSYIASVRAKAVSSD